MKTVVINICELSHSNTKLTFRMSLCQHKFKSDQRDCHRMIQNYCTVKS